MDVIDRAGGRDTEADTSPIDLKGLTPVGVRILPARPVLQWRIGGRLVETDFARFRPVRLFQIEPGNELRAVWRDFADMPMTDPFFKDALQRSEALENKPGEFETDWQVVHSVARQPGNLPLSGVIFHMSRTGSTLIHRLLGRAGTVMSLSEVAMTDRVLHVTAGLPEPERSACIRDLIGVYGQPRRPSEMHYVLKMTDALANIRAAEFHAAFPDTPWIFVYRDPVEVMVSLLKGPTGSMESWFRNRVYVAERLNMPGLGDGALPVERFVARTLRRFCTNAVAAARATPPGKFLAVNYSRLPDAVWETIAPHFGITLTDRQRALMQEESKYSAKKREAVHFTPDTQNKHEQAKPWVRNLAERMVGPMIEELRRLPQA